MPMDAWIEWKERCALALCSQESQVHLSNFASWRFNRYLQRYCKDLYPRRDGGATRDAWHLFETHATMKSSRQGKRYKDWLFARLEGSTDVPINVVQGGASLIIRDVAREFLRREHSAPSMISMDQPITSCGDSSLTWLDVLSSTADPAYELCLREYDAQAAKHAGELMAGMSRRERVAVVAKQFGLSLSHPNVTKSAGCGRSVLADVFHNFSSRITKSLCAQYADDDEASLLILSIMTVRKLAELIMDQKAPKRYLIALFRYIEGNRHAPA